MVSTYFYSLFTNILPDETIDICLESSDNEKEIHKKGDYKT